MSLIRFQISHCLKLRRHSLVPGVLSLKMSFSSWVTKAKDGMEEVVEKATKQANEVDLLGAIPESIMDAKMKSALRDISKIGAEMDRKLSATGKLSHNFLLNIAILRLYTKTKSMTETKDDCYEDCSLDDELFAQSMHYLRYSDLSYSQLPRIAERDVIIHELNDKGKASNIHMPRYIVFFDHLTRSIVVAIRGTASMSDIITDMAIQSEPFVHNGVSMVAHSGIAQAAQTLLGSVQTAIIDARRRKGGKYSQYGVVVTGHSLGAGTACLLGLRLSEQTGIGTDPMDVTVFAFAPPPVLSEPSYRSANCTIHAFVNNADLVPRCCKREIMKMLLTVGLIDKMVWSSGKRTHLVATTTLLSDEDMKLMDGVCSETNYNDVERAVVENEVQLYIPGTSYVITPTTYTPSPLNPDPESTPSTLTSGNAAKVNVVSKFRRVVKPTGLYSGFLFTGDTMLSDHKADNYITAFVATAK